MPRLDTLQSSLTTQGILPSPTIREIKLSYSPFPPKVSNPHIDHERETIVYEGRDGTRNFKHPGFTVKKDPRNLLIEVTVVLRDVIGSNGQSSWILQQDLLKYMKLQVIHSEDVEFTKAIKTHQIQPIPAQIAKHMKNTGIVKTEIRALANHETINKFYEKTQHESTSEEVILKFNFAVNTTSPDHLTYFANVFLDVEQLINDYSLNLSDQMVFTTCGDTAAEAVYRAGKRVDQAKVYKHSKNGAPLHGAMYRVAANKYISAAILNDDMIRRDLLAIISPFNPQGQTSAASRQKQIMKIIRKDSLEETKLQQLNKIMASWKNRRPGTISGRMYDKLDKMRQEYKSKVDSAPQYIAELVPNQTINDVRTTEELSQIDIPEPIQSEAEAAIEDIRTQDSNSVSAQVYANMKNAKYFSNCMITRDSSAATRLFFTLDWGRLAVDSSPNKSVILNSDSAIRSRMTSQIKIKGMRLVRERVDDELTLSQFDNHMTRDRESLVEVIADAAYDSSTGTLSGERTSRTRTSTQKKYIGSMRESNIDYITNKNFRGFEAHDAAISDRRVGKFRYRIEVSFIDETGQLLYSKIGELRSARLELEKYYNICTLSCNYDSVSGKFTDFFRAALVRKYQLPNPGVMTNLTQEAVNEMLSGPSPLNAPWLRPVAKYVEVLKYFNGISDADASTLSKNLYMQLEPASATPDSVLSVINSFETLEKTTMDTLLKTTPENAGYSRDNSKIKQKLTKTQKIVYQFPDVYDNKALSNVGAKYLYYGTEAPTGLTRISKVDFLKRLTEEQSRFFAGYGSDTSNAIDDLLTYRYSYLAPAHIQVGGKNLLLLNRGEGLYTSDQYKEMLFSISLLQTNAAARSLTMPILDWPIGVTQQSSDTDVSTAKLNMGAVTLLANYGISIAAPTPFTITKKAGQESSDPLVEISSVLGENTLLAIRNAVTTAAEDGESKEMVAELANAELSIADVSTLASSLVSTLASTGLQNFLGTSSPFMQVSSMSTEATEKLQLSRTLEFFDLTNPNNAIALQAASSTGQEPSVKIRKIPNQLKSLFLTKTSKSTPIKNWHQVETDPIASPDTRPLFELLYFNLQQIEVLTGFDSTNAQDHKLLRSPRYELLQEKHLAGTGQILCRFKRYRSDTLQIGQNTMLDLPVCNGYFIVELQPSNTNVVNPVVESNLYTAGSEYQTEDGTNYIGYYHIHKDKTVMTGPAMALGDKVLLPSSDITTEANAASSALVATLVPAADGFEKALLSSLVAAGQTTTVSADYCVTEEPILASAGPSLAMHKGVTF